MKLEEYHLLFPNFGSGAISLAIFRCEFFFMITKLAIASVASVHSEESKKRTTMMNLLFALGVYVLSIIASAVVVIVMSAKNSMAFNFDYIFVHTFTLIERFTLILCKIFKIVPFFPRFTRKVLLRLLLHLYTLLLRLDLKSKLELR